MNLSDNISYTVKKDGAVRAAGILFPLCFLIPILNPVLVFPVIMVPGDASATARLIGENQLLFRAGMTIELFMGIGLVFLAVSLYTLLRDKGKGIARVALVLKTVEVSVVISFVLIAFIALAYDVQLAGTLLVNIAGFFAVPMVFLGVNMTLFFYLFYRSQYIPRGLALFGMLSFILIFIHSVIYLFAPVFAARPVNQVIFYSPSALVELAMGAWLLVRGVNVKGESMAGFHNTAG